MNKWIYRVALGLLITAIVVYLLLNKSNEKISFMYADF